MHVPSLNLPTGIAEVGKVVAPADVRKVHSPEFSYDIVEGCILVGSTCKSHIKAYVPQDQRELLT